MSETLFDNPKEDKAHPMGLGGTQRIYEFPNGFGASVVRSPYTYGGHEGLWELAVLDKDGHLTYDTPVTSDVEGWLSEDDVEALLVQIAQLPEGNPNG